MKTFKPYVDKQIKFRIFTCEDISVLLFDYSYGLSQIFLQVDGEWMECTGGMGYSGGGKEKFSFENVRDDKRYEMHIQGEQAFIKNAQISSEFYFLSKTPAVLTETEEFIPLPVIRNVDKILKVKAEHKIFVISSLKYNREDSTEIALIDRGIFIKNLKITNITMYRDGGTAIYETDEGEIFIPSPWKQDRNSKPTLNENIKLEILNSTELSLREKLTLQELNLYL